MSSMTREQQRERVRRRVRSATDPDKYEYTPEKEQTDHIKANEYQRVAIYARVSTDDPSQTSSFELQQKYYEDLVRRYPKWVLVKIYKDEGKSGTSTIHRTGLLEMLQDAFSGYIDLIIVKSVSRLARNVVDFLRTVRKLAEKGIGILFESEAIFSLNSNSQLALSFQATMAEEESRVRSRSMETSLRMRLDHGLPLTPELLGFMHNEDGKLILNPETYKIPKLMFYMYLYGYSTQQIATKLKTLMKKTYLGNINWTATGVARSLRNERYCGDVKTRKTFTRFEADIDHDDNCHKSRTLKNRGERPQSYYHEEHDMIITPDDYLAVQRILSNAKYGGTSLLPELRVIPEGLLKGFVIIHPHWGSFTKDDFINACESVWKPEEDRDMILEMEAGDFDFRHCEVVNFKFFDELSVPAVTLDNRMVRFSTSCVKRMACGSYVELLIHPIKKKIAVRQTVKENRYALCWSKGENEGYEPRDISCQAYIDKIFELFGWNNKYRYKLYGQIYRNNTDSACVFSEDDLSVYVRAEDVLLDGSIAGQSTSVIPKARRVKAFSGDLGMRFGRDFYEEKCARDLQYMRKSEWQTQMDGIMCKTGPKLNITPYEELREFIIEELGEFFEEVESA